MIDTAVITKSINKNFMTRDTEAATIKNMKVEDAARELGKSIQYIRIGLQRGFLKFGTAQIISGGRYTYYISPTLFYESIGKPLPSKYKETEELKGTERYTVITEPISNIGWRR